MRVMTHVPLQLLSRVAAEHPDVELLFVPQQGEPPPDASGEVLLTMAWGSPNLGALVRRGVRWVHAYGTGVNAFPFDALGDRILTCSRGASAIPISEWVLAMLLAFEKGLPDSWIHRPVENWNMASLGGLYGKTLSLLGVGGIATAVAERARPFGMRLLAHRRSRAPIPIPGVERARDFEHLLAEADHLVVAAPATRETRGLLGRDALARVKRGVHLVNVARGELVDQDVLREALDDGRVACASLDTVDPEPLPEGHWLYSHPKVRLSPHISWSAPGALDRLVAPFVENLGRYRRGEPLVGLVDVAAGY
jgi:phosphoglycerate dehydrogenase-like enzyme